jgi:hypothetical protein
MAAAYNAVERQEVAAVIPELLWIIGFYVAAAALAHRIYGHGADERRRHYVLVAGNHQLQIEWYIRALQRFSRRTGTDIGITVVLDHSSDETGKITEIFARGCDKIGLFCTGGSEESAALEVAVAEYEGHEDSTTDDSKGDARQRLLREMEAQGMMKAPLDIVWVELANREDLQRLPLRDCRFGRSRIQ